MMTEPLFIILLLHVAFFVKLLKLAHWCEAKRIKYAERLLGEH